MTKQVSLPNSVSHACARTCIATVRGCHTRAGHGVVCIRSSSNLRSGAQPTKTPRKKARRIRARRDARGAGRGNQNWRARLEQMRLSQLAQSSDHTPEVAGGSESNKDSERTFRRGVGQDCPAA